MADVGTLSVGAGAIGSAAAMRLARMGEDVCVIAPDLSGGRSWAPWGEISCRAVVNAAGLSARRFAIGRVLLEPLHISLRAPTGSQSS